MNTNAKVYRLFVVVFATVLMACPVLADLDEPVLGLQDSPIVSLGGAGVQETNIVYDATNQAVNAGTSSTDLLAIYGDEMILAGGIGEDVSAMKFAVFCSGSSTGALVSANETLRFYDLTNAGAFIGGISLTLGPLSVGYYSIYTMTDIEDAVQVNIPSADVLVTQQLRNVVGASRMGTVLSYANAPAVGATNNGFYASTTTMPAGWYLITGQTYSNLQYELETAQVVIPTESKTWSSLKAEFR